MQFILRKTVLHMLLATSLKAMKNKF